MTQVFDKPSIAYRVVVAASAWLVVCWVMFLAFIATTTIDKQSVYEGPITFYGALLYGITAIALLVMIPAWIRVAYKKHPSLRAASYWALGATAVMTAVSVLTQMIIIKVIG